MSAEEANKLPEQQAPEGSQAQDVVSKSDYEAVLAELQKAKTYEEKAQLLDELMEDDEFQSFLTKDKSAATQTQAPTKDDKDKSLAEYIKETIAESITPLKKEIETMKVIYDQDKSSIFRQEADREIDKLEADKENFPFFGKPEVKSEMVKVLESGRATNMVDAYRLATYNLAKASGRDERLNKSQRGLKGLDASDSMKARSDRTKDALTGKRGLRDIISDAYDKVGLLDSEEEGD